MPAARRQLWLVALAFVILGAGIYLFYFRLRGADIQIAQGRHLYDQGKYALAEAAYEQAAKLSPEHADAWYWLGISRKNQGKDAEAAEALAQATELNPGNVNWWIESAEALQWAGRFVEADKAWRKALELLPPEDARVTKARVNLARVLVARGETAAALQVLNEMLARKDDRQLRFVMAELLGYAGKFEESAEQYRLALGDQPTTQPEN